MARFCHLVVALAVAQAGSLPIGDLVSLIQHTPAASTVEYEGGELVEVPVQMKGEKDVTWIPATVVKPRFSGFYDVNVALGPADRYVLQIPGLAAKEFRKIEKRSDWDRSKRFYSDYPKDAKAVVDQIEVDIHKRTMASLYAQGLNKHQVQKKMEEMGKAKKAKLERDTRMQGCPKGYQAVVGDGKGGDQFGRKDGNKQDTMDLCMQDCEKHPRCLSFEWSPNSKTCNLNRVAEPFKNENFLDFVFCKKTGAH